MAGILLSGPAGAGKSARAALLLEATENGVIVDFQTILAALLGLRRGPDGRYPPRRRRDSYALPLAERLRLTMMAFALRDEINLIVTNSDGSRQRRQFLLARMGADAVEEVIDPGIAVVRARLAEPDGSLSDQCEEAIGRWYNRL